VGPNGHKKKSFFPSKTAAIKCPDQQPTLPKTTSAPSSRKKNLRRDRQRQGPDARDIMLGLAKTCMKLKLSFYEFIGARLGIPGQNPAPRKPHPASPRINPTSLAREFAPLR